MGEGDRRGKRERTSGNQAREKKKKRESPRPSGRRGSAKCSGENRERKRGRRRIVGDGEGGEGGGDGGERGARSEAGGGTGRRGVVLTRTGAFLIIICLSLGISREERGKPRGEWRRNGGDRRVPRKKRARMVEKEGAGPWRKKEREGEAPRKSRREARGKEREKETKREE